MRSIFSFAVLREIWPGAPFGEISRFILDIDVLVINIILESNLCDLYKKKFIHHFSENQANPSTAVFTRISYFIFVCRFDPRFWGWP